MKLLLPFFLLGCSENNALKSLDSADDADTGANDSEADNDTANGLDPAWYAPRAVIDVLDEQATLSQISISIVDSDLSTVVCSVPLDSTVAVSEAAPETLVYAWLSLPVTPLETPCATLPDRIGIGIGALSNDVRAQLGPSGLSDVADSLYGAYLRAPDDAAEEVTTFGYAGTPDDLAGDNAASAPLPDGQYVLNPLFLLQLPYDG